MAFCSLRKGNPLVVYIRNMTNLLEFMQLIDLTFSQSHANLGGSGAYLLIIYFSPEE